MLQVEIRSTATCCPECGAGKLMLLPRNNESLSVDLVELLGPEPGPMRPLARKAHRRLRSHILDAAAQVKEETAKL
jgi:hypothetical protein